MNPLPAAGSRPIRSGLRSGAQGGFSLIEVLLAVTIAISLGSLQLSQLRQNVEYAQATAVGEQLKSVGMALNSYITLHYGQITALSNVAGAGTAADPGPRTCNVGTGMCTITSQTLILNGLLPQSFSGLNSYGANYQYYILVTGSAPNWNVSGMVVTSDPYAVGGAPRFDLIGQAMMAAGADSGTTRVLPTRLDGYDGTWADSSFSTGPGFPNVLGIMAYRVGYGTSGYSAYMRLDGTTPMTGDLNLDDGTTKHNLVGANNITAAGVITGSSFVTTAPNAAAIILGANTPANQTTLGNSGTALVVRNQGGTQFLNSSGVATPIQAGTATLGDVNSSGAGVFQGAVSAASLSTTSGNIVSAADIAANGKIYTNSGNISSNTGDIYTTSGSIYTTNGGITAYNGAVSGKQLIAGGTDIFDPNHWQMGNGGGWTMLDGTTMTLFGAQNLTLTGTVSAGNATIGGVINLTGSKAAGGGCTVGQVARDGTGQLLACVSGVWRTTGLNNITVGSGTGTSTCPAGTKVVSCGYALIFRTNVNSPWSPTNMGVSGNGCVATSSSPDPSSFTSYAYCAN